MWLINAVFTQKFVSFDKVTLSTDTIGLQLPERADVKIRGVIIGEVTKAESGPNGAVLTLGIKPSEMKNVPANVTASILPKTLFGEKYVELVVPKGTDPLTAPSIKAGASITQTQLPIEVQKVLSDLYPLLRAVQPAELNYTLNALANALEGRGEAIGQNIETLNSYLTRLNPQVPALVEDLRLLAKVSGTYADVAPQIAETLRNTVKTGNTLVTREVKLHAFLNDVSSFSDTATRLPGRQRQQHRPARPAQQAAAEPARRYAPEFPCLLDGIVKQAPMLGSTFRGFVFHIDLITLPRQPRGVRRPGPAGERRRQRAVLRRAAEPAGALQGSSRTSTTA